VTLAPRRTLPVAVLALIATHAAAQPPSAAAAAPGAGSAVLSPGAAALLIDGKVTAVELNRWAELLADSRPLSRATAARLATVSGARPLGPALVAALEKETDAMAAAEEMLAVGSLAPGTGDGALFAAADRFPGALDPMLARSISSRGKDAVALTPRLKGRRLANADWTRFFAWSTGNGRVAVDDAASAALETGDPIAWEAVLSIARVEKSPLAPGVLARGVASPSERVREETYWYLVFTAAAPPEPGSPLAVSLATTPDNDGREAPVASFARELLRRAFGEPPRPQTTRLAAMTEAERTRLPTRFAAIRLLTKEERKPFGEARFGDDAGLERVIEGKGAFDGSYDAVQTRTTIQRTADPPPDGLSREVLAAAGCGVVPRAVLEIRYDASGQRQTLGMVPPPGIIPGCLRAARVLLITSLVPGPRPPRPNQVESLSLVGPSFASCAAEAGSAVGPPGRVDGHRIVEPRKVHNVAPEYPASARAQHRDGVVILEAVISPTGAVCSVEVLRGAGADLDRAAIEAVAQWRYTPTLLDGVPVPVIMTVTVNFKLSY
jgi:TonB family protein